MAKKLSELYAIGATSFTEHAADILRLWTQFDDEEKPDQRKIDWLYRANPEGKGTAVGLWYRPESHLAGVMCFSRRTLCFEDTELDSCLIADLIIERKHRALGPFRLISEKAVKMALESYELMFSFPVVTSPTPGLGDIVERDVDYVVFVLPLQLQPYLNRRVPALLAAIGGYVIGPLSRLPVHIAWWRLRRRYMACSVDAAFIDGLWERTRRIKRLQGIRTSDNVLWRLQQPPFKDHRLLGIADSDGQPAAMIVYQVTGDETARIVDLCWVDLESAEAALATLIRSLRSRRIRSLSIMSAACFSEFTDLLARLGLRERRRRTLRIIATPNLTDIAHTNEVWIQPLDNDYV